MTKGDFTKSFALFDRDGTIIREREYSSDSCKIELIPGAVEEMLLLQSLGLGLTIITNQSGIGRGYFRSR